MKDKYINILAVGIGGSLGAIVRYFFNISFIHADFPIATLFVNVLGSLVLGFITGLSLKIIKKTWLKLALGTGFCGGFTTMSTFAADTMFLLSDGEITLTLFYIILTVIGAMLAVYLGLSWAIKLSKQSEGMHF